jgi:tRNA threonylcarbamoyladenosine biosynthesis protein TsaB
MIVLGMDTATPATAVALLDDARAGEAAYAERRHDPPPGERPGHAAQLLALGGDLLAEAGLRFADVQRIAVGLGPGTFTGLRIGVATARALAQGSGAELVGVSTLRALAAAAEPAAPAGTGVLAVIDARRGEVFAAGWRDGAGVLEQAALAPGRLAERVAQEGGAWLAVGDGALRFRADLEGAGCSVAPDGCAQHRVSARAICELALQASQPIARDLVLPDYLRLPDAVLARHQPRVT